MNNNENLNQQSVTQGTNVTNSTPFENPVNTTGAVANVNQPVTTNVQSSTNITQPVTNNAQPVNSNVQFSQTAFQQQRVKLVDDKPAIQAVVPNNSVSVKPVNSEVSTNDNVEILEEETHEVGNVGETVPTDNKGSKLRTFFVILLFGGLLVMVIFLPDISSYIETQKYLKTQTEEIITTGTLKCEFENSSEELDYNYSLDFIFSDSKLTRLTYVTEIRGDINLDAEKLDLLKAECDQLALNAEKLGGVSVSCELNSSLLTKKQTLNYSAIDVNEAISAYMEAGGVYPDYENGQSIDEIEKDMNASGYSCERIK